jgi:hypothetical protein
VRAALRTVESRGVRARNSHTHLDAATLALRTPLQGVAASSLALGSGCRSFCAAAGAGAALPPGYTATSSGLAYMDEVVGQGPQPSAGAHVHVHYTGRLADGTK